MKITKKIMSVLLCVTLIFGLSATAFAQAQASVTYYIGDTVVKTDSAYLTSQYKPTAYAPDLRPELVPANSYFTGWYNNAQCSGSPISPDGVYAPSEGLNLYAGFKQYESSFTPHYSTEGFERFDINRVHLFFPRMMDYTFVPNIQDTRYSKTTTTTDIEGDEVWRLVVTGASPYFLYDENAVAYQVKSGSSYKISFEYKYEFPASTTTEVFVGVGIGSAKTNFTSDGKMTGDANRYKYQENFIKILPSSQGTTAQTNWESCEVVLGPLTEEDMEDYYPILGFRTTHSSVESCFDIKNLTIEEMAPPSVKYFVGETAIKTVNLEDGQSYTFENINLNSEEYKQYIPEGYYFTGWYTDEECTKLVAQDKLTETVAVAGSVCRYAGLRKYEESFTVALNNPWNQTMAAPFVYHGDQNVYLPFLRQNIYTKFVAEEDYYKNQTGGCGLTFFTDDNYVAYQADPNAKYRITFDYKYTNTNTSSKDIVVGLGYNSFKEDGNFVHNDSCADSERFASVTSVSMDANTATETDWQTATVILSLIGKDITNVAPVFGIGNRYMANVTYKIKNVKVEKYIPEPVSVVYNYLDTNGNPAQRVVTEGVEYQQDYAIDFLAPNTKNKYFVDWYLTEDFSGEPISTSTVNIDSDGAKNLYAKYVDYPASAELVLPGNGTAATKVHMPIITNAEFGKQSTDKIAAYKRQVNSSIPFIKSSTYDAETNSTLFEVNSTGATSSAHILTDKDGNFVAGRPGATYKMTFLAKSTNGTAKITFGASIPRTHFQLFYGDPQWYRAPNNNSGYNELLHKSGEATINATEDYEEYSLVVTIPENISDNEYNFLGMRITGAERDGSVSVKDIFVYEIDINAKEEMFVSFENYMKFSKNAVLDETNNYVIAANKAEHTVWESINDNGRWTCPVKKETLYTVYESQGFAPENFQIVSGGMNSDKALKFKQTASGTQYKVADISNGVLLKDNTTYTATFYYKAEGSSDKDLKFSVVNALNSEMLGMITDANTVVIPANEVASDWTKVVLTFTTDFGYHNADYAISSEMFCIPVLCINHDINDTERTVYVDSVSLETSIASGGVSVLDAEAEAIEGSQALRVYFNYLPDENGKITIGGEKLSVVKRGVLLIPANKLNNKTDADGYFIREKVETPNFFVKENASEYGFIASEKSESLTDCWANENGVLTYSVYIKNFEVNDENEIAVRGWIELSDGRVIYSDIYTYNVSDVKLLNEMGSEKTYYSFSDSAVTEKLVLQGNSKVLDTGITSDWSGQTVKFKAHCVGDITVKVHNPLGTEVRFKVLVDGNRVTGEFRPVGVDAQNSISEFTFNVGNKPQNREIQISRITEVNAGPTEIMGVEFIGELNEAEESETLIEFIGDSITCGTGGGGEGISDGTRTYAYLTVQTLGVDFRIRSRSGSGFKTSSGGGTGLGESWPETYVVDSYVRSETTPYSHTRNADVVCIYLGTNDSAANSGKSTEERNAYFVDGMKNLISIVKQYNPNAKFVWITGGMTNGYRDAAITAMNDLGGEANGYYVCELPSGLNAGGAGHPDYDQHAQMAGVLSDFLLEKELVK